MKLDQVSKKHIRSHNMEEKVYAELVPLVSDAALTIWHARLDLQKAFPEPMNPALSVGTRLKSFKEWIDTIGVKEFDVLKPKQ